MAYISGTANSFADLLTAIQNACTSNGWGLAGNVLSRGGGYVSLDTSVADALKLQGGLGIDGSNNLTGLGPAAVYVAGVTQAISFPVSYFIHILTDPDEVYVVINFAVSLYQYLAFGQSPAPGLPGTGNWYAATTWGVSANSITITGNGSGSGAVITTPAPFWIGTTETPGGVPFYLHHNLDGAGWAGRPTAVGRLDPLVARQPNAWNGETALLPIHPSLLRASNKVSMIGVLRHARYLRNDNLADQSLITLGADTWRTYPFYKKNASARDGGPGIADSGTFGWAIRYDGP